MTDGLAPKKRPQRRWGDEPPRPLAGRCLCGLSAPLMGLNRSFKGLRRGRSCPPAWCNWRWGTAFAGKSRAGQLAIAGRLTVGSSLNGAMVSSVM